MVATKRSPQPEVNNAKEKRSGTTEAGTFFQKPLGGFIFFCNNETMDEDFERHLFGLPQRHIDSVKAIEPGLPLFLYNYTTRRLHGVFEASSDGGLNIEPDAWGENKESRKNGRHSVSRFPAQVRVRMREHRPPLEEEKFRPVLYHYDGLKFRPALSPSEAQELLKLFGASQIRKGAEDVPDDNGGEWEKVKTKSKLSRSFRATPAKGCTSPNATAGRRRGSAQNCSNGNGTGNGSGNGSVSTFNNSMHETVSRGRDRENRVDNSQRWRSDSDSWSGSSSAGTATSSWGSNEDERPKKGLRENGCAAEANGGGGEGHDYGNGLASKGFSQTNGHYDNDSKVDIRFVVDSNETNGSISALSAESRNAVARSGFVSYSAALKSGMLAAAAAENGVGDGSGSIVAETGNSSQSSTVSGSSRALGSSAAGADCVSSSSPVENTKGEFSADRIEQFSEQAVESKRPFFLLNIGSYSEAAGSGNQVKVGSQSSVEKKCLESLEHLSNGGETDCRKAEKTQPWGKPMVVKAVNLADLVSGQQSGVVDNRVSGIKDAGDVAPSVKTSGKDGLRDGTADGENGGHHGFGNFEGKEGPVKPVETVVRKNVWQGNEGAVLRLLHDPDPAVNSGSVNGGINEQRVESEMYRGKDDRVKSPQPHVQNLNAHPAMERLVYVPSPALDGQLTQWPDQSSSPTSTAPTHVSLKSNQQQGSLFHQNRSGHESRRQHYDNQKHDKHLEDRAHFRKQQIHPPEHSQHPASMMHSQQRQLGQGLMPLRIPTPPPGMQQMHHHAILSPAPLYRDRSRGRGGNGSSDGSHGLAYRPISRNIIDGDIGLQSPMGPGSWTMQSPVLLMQPLITPLSISGNFNFSLPPTHVLTNVEALHAEILEFAQASRPSAETRVHAEAAVECVRDGVKKFWPEADVEVFGSFATGLCLQNSDVDVVVVDAPTPPDTPEIAALSGARLLCPLIRALSASLKEHEWCEGINTIETASMPVIKLRCRPVKANGFSSEPPVAIDVTIGGRRSENFAGMSQANSQKDANERKPYNPAFEAARSAHNGAAAREFVIEKLRQLPALAPLVLLMKSFLQQRGLNDVYSGGLGSFALTLMLVFYLERVPISCGLPQEVLPPTTPVKSPSSVNLEASSLSVDTSNIPSAAAESVASSDDDSTDSSVLTTTSVSSFASLEVPSVQGSSCAGDEVASQASPSTGQLLLRRAGGMVEELLASMQSVSSPNLGTLLVGFLHVFGHEIDFSRVRLVLKGKNGSPGGFFCHEKMARTLPLWIDDPLRPDAIIGAGSFNIWQVQASMREMLYTVTRPLSVPGTPLPGTPVDASDRSGKGPGRRRPLPLLDQMFLPSSTSPGP